MHFEFDVGLQDMVSLLATVCTFALLLTPIGTCRKIVRKGSSSDASFFPFLVMFSTSSLWLKYGLMKNDRTLQLINCIGAVLCFTYMVVYYVYTLHKSMLYKQMLGAGCILFPVLIYVQYFTVSHSHAAIAMGRVCAVGSICSYGSPLSAMKDVLRTESTECMSFSLSLANFIVATEWTMYGYFLHDVYIVMPNMIGLLFAGVQLYLFYKYPVVSSTSKGGPVVHS